MNRDMNEYGRTWKDDMEKTVLNKTMISEKYVTKSMDKIFEKIKTDKETKEFLESIGISEEKPLDEIIRSIYDVYKDANNTKKQYIAEKIAGVSSSYLFHEMMNTFDTSKAESKADMKSRERVRLGRLVLQVSNGGGMTAPDWDFVLKGIYAIDEVTIKGLVSDIASAVRTVSDKLKEHDVVCGRMTVEVVV